MKKYVALLRGINVGGNNKVDMKALRAAFESLGFADVSTYINSGNVLFSSEKQPDTKKIEKHLEKTLGFPIRTLVRKGSDIKKICREVPESWQNDKTQKTDVLFLWGGYDSQSSLKLIDTKPKVDKLKYVAGAIVWRVDRKDYNQSGMNKFASSELYKHVTARNINTVRKLAKLLE